MQFLFSYLQGLKLAPGVAMLKGTGLDRAAEYFFEYKIMAGANAPVEDSVEAGVTAVELEINDKKDEIYFADSSPGKVIDDVARMSRAYCSELAPQVNPINTQAEHIIEPQELVRVAGADCDPSGLLPVYMYTDVEEDDCTIDIKGSSKTPAQMQAQIETEVQPMCISLAKNLEGSSDEFLYHVSRPLKTKTDTFVVEMQQKNHMHAANLIIGIQEAIIVAEQTGVFMPTGFGTWVCADKWCGYHRTGVCPYAKKG
jgi:hypothetical protein